MQPKYYQNWELTEKQAIQTQIELSKTICQEDQFENINIIAGVDVAYAKSQDLLVAAVVLIDAHSCDIIESKTIIDKPTFPYIPGLFSFRELPSLERVFAQLAQKPDLVVCDGQGMAHPRHFGLACHLGVIYDIPVIGCAKTRFWGEVREEPSIKRGNVSYLYDNDVVIGASLRTQDNVKPVYVSIGHKISLETACQWVLKLASKYRLPETTRQADQIVNKLLKKIAEDD